MPAREGSHGTDCSGRRLPETASKPLSRRGAWQKGRDDRPSRSVPRNVITRAVLSRSLSPGPRIARSRLPYRAVGRWRSSSRARSRISIASQLSSRTIGSIKADASPTRCTAEWASSLLQLCLTRPVGKSSNSRMGIAISPRGDMPKYRVQLPFSEDASCRHSTASLPISFPV